MAATVSHANSKRIVYMSDLHGGRPSFFVGWERLRHGKLHWLAESFAEAMGVFMYVYAGVGSTAVWVIGNLTKEIGFSSLLQIGLGYAAGIMLAITICSATSGGHFNPCITIVQMLFKGFPPLKGARYIASQIFGGYIACLLIYYQYSTILKTIEATVPPATLAAIQYTPNGPAGIFALYVTPGTPLGPVFVNEFITDFFLALVIFGCVDPSNVLIPPSMAPVIIALAYAAAIWGYAGVGLSANTARDVGGRLAAMTIWGKDAAGTSGYAALAALTNIPATILACIVYELMFVDSDRVVSQEHREFHDIHALHRRHGQAAIAAADGSSNSSVGHEKEHLGTVERV
ncbi:aquaporin-like protein [Mycena albidolilacea]|uniref:Aquaporin-like protein n=1 Tax=Mycena albidolilacea TaxID=1033008 RepID=A0AAD6ZTX0_9AGAR|nr:aquaporin-like protein [Mycena albidolilacea]